MKTSIEVLIDTRKITFNHFYPLAFAFRRRTSIGAFSVGTEAGWVELWMCGKHISHQFSVWNRLQTISQRHNWTRFFGPHVLAQQQCHTPVKPKIIKPKIIMTCPENARSCPGRGGWEIKPSSLSLSTFPATNLAGAFAPRPWTPVEMFRRLLTSNLLRC